PGGLVAPGLQVGGVLPGRGHRSHPYGRGPHPCPASAPTASPVASEERGVPLSSLLFSIRLLVRPLDQRPRIPRAPAYRGDKFLHVVRGKAEGLAQLSRAVGG